MSTSSLLFLFWSLSIFQKFISKFGRKCFLLQRDGENLFHTSTIHWLCVSWLFHITINLLEALGNYFYFKYSTQTIFRFDRYLCWIYGKPLTFNKLNKQMALMTWGHRTRESWPAWIRPRRGAPPPWGVLSVATVT